MLLRVEWIRCFLWLCLYISCIRDNKYIKFLMNYINENIKFIM